MENIDVYLSQLVWKGLMYAYFFFEKDMCFTLGLDFKN